MLKTEGGWRLEQPEPGVFVWTSPLGRTYRISPEPILPPPSEPVPAEPDSNPDEPPADQESDRGPPPAPDESPPP